MSKREELVEVDLFADHSFETPPKKHKRHKKHKKKKTSPSAHIASASISSTLIEYDSDAVDVVNDIPEPMSVIVDESPHSLELSVAEKLKTQSTPKMSISLSKSQKRKKGRNKDSGTSSEEERWLDAIESGKLEQVDDELKKIKDPKLMTARQRAMYERGTDKETSPGGELLMALPSGYKEKVMTAEAIQKAQIKSLKRKQLADEKREKDKKKTMERLLKKQDSKISKNQKNRPAKTIVPVISYAANIFGATITFPANIEGPLQQRARLPPIAIPCAICNAPKRYNCSRTSIPLCSFKCYKMNVDALKQIIC